MGSDSKVHHLKGDGDDNKTLCGRNILMISVKTLEEWITIWDKAKCEKCAKIENKKNKVGNEK